MKIAVIVMNIHVSIPSGEVLCSKNNTIMYINELIKYDFLKLIELSPFYVYKFNFLIEIIYKDYNNIYYIIMKYI